MRRCTSSTKRRSTTSRGEVAAEQTIDMPRNVLAILLDIFEVQENEKVREEICGILESYMLNLLSSGAYGSVAYLLARDGAADRARAALAPAHKQRLARAAHEPERSEGALAAARSPRPVGGDPAAG